MKLSLCITTYNRPQMTVKAFEKVYADPRIDEVVIVDDKSTIENLSDLYELLINLSGSLPAELRNKWNLYTNTENLGMSRNKARALELAKNDWCILFDSDNVIDVDYLDAFFRSIENQVGAAPKSNMIYCPDFAKPSFDYIAYSGQVFDKFNAKNWIKQDGFNCLLNTCNYVVHRQTYLDTYVHNPEHRASDTIWHNYNHLLMGGSFYIVPGMQYMHLVHPGSGYLQEADYNIKQSEKVRKLIREL